MKIDPIKTWMRSNLTLLKKKPFLTFFFVKS